MTTNITYTHAGVEIDYDEHRNLWCFTLRGRDRSELSLAQAKETINKQPAEKAKPFEKIEAWKCDYRENPERVTVTGEAEKGYGVGPYVWVQDANGKRSKEEAPFRIFPSNEKNDAVIAQVLAIKKAMKDLIEKEAKLKQTLDPLELPKD